jgi:hypothetical protein
MLPGMRAARAQIDVAIYVLEYFESYAEREFETGDFPVANLVSPSMLESIEQLKAALSTFDRLRERPA